MNWLFTFFNATRKFFNKIFDLEFAGSIIIVLEGIAPMVNAVYPIVKRIAEFTPTGVDDAVIRLYEEYGVANFFDETKEKNLAFRDLAKVVLLKSFPNASESSLNTAVELAYKTMKEQTAIDKGNY